MSTKKQNHAEQQPATSAFLTEWLNKLTSLLSKKGPEFLSLGRGSLPSETNVRKREHIHQLKVMKNRHPHSSLEQDDIVNSLNYEGIAVIELQFYHFPDSDRLRIVALSQTK